MTVHWGIMGLGNIARRFAQSMTHETESVLYSVYSRSEEKGKAYCDAYHCKFYTDMEEFLSDPELDIVYLALPHGFHKEYALNIMKHGKAVLCEKPAGLNFEEAKEMVGYSEEHHILFVEAMKYAFTPIRPVLKERMKDIGEITSITASFCTDQDHMENFTSSYLYQKGQGGSLLDTGTYPLTFVRDLCGNNMILQKAELSVDINDVDHHMKAEYRSGNTAVIIETALNENKERTAVITGTEGEIRVPYYYRADHFDIVKDHKTETVNIPLLHDDFTGEIRGTVEACQNGWNESPLFTHEDTLTNAALLDEIRTKAEICQCAYRK